MEARRAANRAAGRNPKSLICEQPCSECGVPSERRACWSLTPDREVERPPSKTAAAGGILFRGADLTALPGMTRDQAHYSAAESPVEYLRAYRRHDRVKHHAASATPPTRDG